MTGVKIFHKTSGDAKDACVILLFKSWVLDTRIKFSIACVGVIALGSISMILLYSKIISIETPHLPECGRGTI